MTDNKKPTREEAEAAVRIMLAWAGDDPSREGLLETPKRVVNSYKEFFGGYQHNPAEVLTKVFEEIEGYDEMVLLEISELNLTVSIIWCLLLVLHMWDIYLIKELLA